MKNDIKTTNMERIDKASLLDVDTSASIKFDDKIYHIKRHVDTTILIYDENDTVLYEPVLPILREINISNNLGIDLKHSSGHIKNTRVLGKDIINRINENI
ncbi:MAG: hypothetical protein ACSHXA_16590 [Polaribacter sp.]|jgi:hypothetical protein|uniref:hypothetical protein n=1 Tax=Polaribacter sp. TaxID=1920175 RepID=UPI003EF23E02